MQQDTYVVVDSLTKICWTGHEDVWHGFIDIMFTPSPEENGSSSGKGNTL